MYIFTIFDRVSEKAGNIFTCSTLAEGERQFIDALQNSQVGSLFRTHPDDFSLRLLGEFDPEKVEITDTKSVEVAKGQPLAPLPADASA